MGGRSILLIGAAFIALTVLGGRASAAADITAEQSALLHDLLAPAAEGRLPAGGGKPNGGMVGRALGILGEEKLLSPGGRPNFQETGILENYGKALFLGNRAPEFAEEIGRIRDIVSSGDRPALEAALTDLWVKAGRARPDSKALVPVIDSLYGAKNQEPEETIRHVFEKPSHRVEMVHARAGGHMLVDVTTRDKKGRDHERTVFQGTTETIPEESSGGTPQLQRRLRLDKVCTSNPETDKKTIKALEGEWTARAQGRTWTITRKGDDVTLTELRESHPPLVYTGTYHLGRITATHPITAITDMDESLPASVRQQLTTMNISFRIALELCGTEDADELRGTWSSQHVTYDGMTFSVSRIHDPYDLSLILTRGSEGQEKIAQGAAKGELL